MRLFAPATSFSHPRLRRSHPSVNPVRIVEPPYAGLGTDVIEDACAKPNPVTHGGARDELATVAILVDSRGASWGMSSSSWRAGLDQRGRRRGWA